jgi:hypothetical protein
MVLSQPSPTTGTLLPVSRPKEVVAPWRDGPCPDHTLTATLSTALPHPKTLRETLRESEHWMMKGGTIVPTQDQGPSDPQTLFSGQEGKKEDELISKLEKSANCSAKCNIPS